MGYIDIGVMMQKPSSGKEKELKEHYKVTYYHSYYDCRNFWNDNNNNSLVHLYILA